MLHGIWQLTRQSLTLDARRLGPHLVRFGLVAILFIAIFIARMNFRTSAPGLSLFHAQLVVTFFYLSINAIFGFSQTITEEKEEDNLGLLRLAGISSLSIVLGKTVGKLCDAMFLIAIQFPFTLLAITLGGVSWPQVRAAYLALAAYLWLLATFGIGASVWQRTGTAAARVTGLFVLLYAVPPLLFSWSWWTWTPLAGLYRVISLPLRLLQVTASSFDESPWCPAVVVGLGAGAFFLLLAWWGFDRVALFDTPALAPAPVMVRKRTSRRAWTRPLVWREYLFLAGGMRGLSIRIAAQLALLGVMCTVHSSIGMILVWTALCSGLLGLLDGTWTASRLFRDELRHRTWPLLRQTPESTGQIAFEKLCGWALGVAPAIIFPYVFIVATLIFHEHVTDSQMRMELAIGSVTTGIAVFAYLHLLVLLSLHFGWTATPMTLTACFTAGWLYMAVIFKYLSIEQQNVALVITSLVLFGAMFGLQRLILRRLAQES